MDEIHFNHWLPYFDNSSYDIVLNVYLPPASIERITITIMPDDATLNGEQEIDGEENRFIESQSRSSMIPIPSPQNIDEIQQLLNMARNQARKDVKETKKHTKDGKFVRINWRKVADESDTFAEKALETIYTGSKIPDDCECERLVAEYQETYLRCFKERLNDPLVDYFDTELEAQLREFAVADREKIPLENPYYLRDLGVIRAIVLLDVRPDIADHCLADIHKWVDKYVGYYSNPREEVNWPDCRGSF